MGKVLPQLTDGLRDSIGRQRMFFVATTPAGGHVNLSPKGMDCFRVLGPTTLAPHFPPARPGVRQIIVAELTRVQTSCGFGVPAYTFGAERDGLVRWADETGADGLADYQREKNTASIDGLPTPLASVRGPA